MPSLQPEVLPPNAEATAASSENRSRLALMAAIVPLIASVVGNAIQLAGAANDRRETQAKIENLELENKNAAARLTQDQRESSERLAQTWLEQLRKFDSLDDRALVLNAAISTTSDARVRAWAESELTALRAELEKKKQLAQEQLTAPAAPVAVAAAEVPQVVVGGAGGGVVPKPAKPADSKPELLHAAALPKNARVAAATMNSHQAASVDLLQLNKTETVLKDAEQRLRASAVAR